MQSKTNNTSSNFYQNQPKRDFSSYPESKETNQIVSNPQPNFEAYLNELRVKKSNLEKENVQILNEIENFNELINFNLETQEALIQELVDRKCKNNIMTKEMNIKRNYVIYLVKQKKNSKENENKRFKRDVESITNQLIVLLEKMEIFTDSLLAGGLEIPKLEEIDFDRFATNLIKCH